MTEHYINRGTEGNTNYNKKLEQVMQEVGEDDKLIITFDQSDADKSDYILDLLEKNGFEVLPKGGHEKNNYQLVARRIKS